MSAGTTQTVDRPLDGDGQRQVPDDFLMGTGFTWLLFLVAGLSVSIGIFWLMSVVLGGQGEDTSNEDLRLKAEAVLEARFNDTQAESFGPMVTLRVAWESDKMIATWVQSTPQGSKECVAPVVMSADEQSFGIEPFVSAPLPGMADTIPRCIISTDLVFGLPLEE